jgi:protein SCO1/2
VQPQEAAWQKAIWGALVLVLIGVVGAGTWSLLPRSSSLPIYGTVPDFLLTERSGRPLAQADLAGKIWIANFIFTRCPGACPLLISRMAHLQAALRHSNGKPIKLVSFSVDPEWDTPETLQHYADRYGADPEQWLFLTGNLQAMQRLISEGFRLSMAGLPAQEAQASGPPVIAHSNRFVLVDDQLQIRGYYHGSEEESLARLLGDVEALRHGQK